MKNQDWEKIKQVLQVLEQPKPMRPDFLRRTCTGDTKLLSEIESLLTAHEETEFIIERKNYSAVTAFGASGAGYAGKEFGHYRIKREIGRGGMGAVFLAARSDGAFDREVALKIVRRSFADNELGRRFRQERQILANLNHPNIARLLDGGVSEDGEPFLAMEYVEGKRIDDFCDEENLSVKERLKLFLAVCDAVSFAHQNLIVHRDIKPSNILVTKDGVPKLLDFGIAKLLDAEHADEHTQTNYRAFTPDYASPEQIAGKTITTASDVYSLGVLLEEILSARRNSNDETQKNHGWQSNGDGSDSTKKTVAANLRTNRAENPKPKILNSNSIVAELKNIIAMARREDPSRRYASVAQFVEDVQRFLDGLPVRARKDSFTYRTEKFVRRNRALVGAGALIVLLTIVGFAGVLWQATIARRERDRAEKRFTDVRSLSNALLDNIAPRFERLRGSTDARRALVVESLKYLDSLASESSDDLSLQGELAAAYEKIGDLQGAPRKPNLGDFSGALASLDKAETIRRRLLEINPMDAENKKNLAKDSSQEKYIRWWSGDFSSSLPETVKTLETYENILREENQNSLEWRLAIAETQINLAQMYSFNDQLDKIHPLLEKARAMLTESPPDNREVRRLNARIYTLEGNTLSWENKQSEAESEMAIAIKAVESLAADYPRDAQIILELHDAYMQTANIYEGVDDKISMQFLVKAQSIISEAINEDAANIQARQYMAKLLSKLAVVSSRLKNFDAAASYTQRSLQIITDLQKNEPQNKSYQLDTGRNLTFLGLANAGRKNYEQALENYQSAIAAFEEVARANADSAAPRRQLEAVHSYVGELETELSRAAITPAERKRHRELAVSSFGNALEILRELDRNQMLNDYDRRYQAKIQTALEKLSAK